MVLGKNKGQNYESDVFEILDDAGLIFPGTTSEGLAGGADAEISINHKKYHLEIKNGLGADFGQKKFNWSKKNGWTFSENDDVTKFFKKIGVLRFLNKKKIIPRRYTVPQNRITVRDAHVDQVKFEDRTFTVPASYLWRYYSEKNTHYIQVGSGYGFYHLDLDPARLGTPRFNCGFILRFRAKYHDHFKRKKDANGKVISKKATPWNYSFFAVLKVDSRKKPKRSKFNLEEKYAQKFPPIKP